MSGVIRPFYQDVPPQSGTVGAFGEDAVDLNSTFYPGWINQEFNSAYEMSFGSVQAEGAAWLHFEVTAAYSAISNAADAVQIGNLRVHSDTLHDSLPSNAWVEVTSNQATSETRYEQHLAYDLHVSDLPASLSQFIVVLDAAHYTYDPESNGIPRYTPGPPSGLKSLSARAGFDHVFPGGWVAVPFYLTYEWRHDSEDAFRPYTYGRWFVFGDPRGAALEIVRMRRLQRDQGPVRRSLGAGVSSVAGSLRRGFQNRAI